MLVNAQIRFTYMAAFAELASTADFYYPNAKIHLYDAGFSAADVFSPD